MWEQVEEAIMSEVPGVSECAVAGVPSAAGDECWAWIVLRAGAP